MIVILFYYERKRLQKRGAYVKKIVDDARLIYKCCYLYYVDGMGAKGRFVMQ